MILGEMDVGHTNYTERGGEQCRALFPKTP
jgi:hypothetical protein